MRAYLLIEDENGDRVCFRLEAAELSMEAERASMEEEERVPLSRWEPPKWPATATVKATDTTRFWRPSAATAAKLRSLFGHEP